MMGMIKWGNTPGPCKPSCDGVDALSEVCSSGIMFQGSLYNYLCQCWGAVNTVCLGT